MKSLLSLSFIMLLTGCNSVPKKYCYEMSITLSHQTICTSVKQTESPLMKRIEP